MFGAAGRVERFSDFGATVNGKVAGRARVAGALALRGNASTGFRAPTAGQQNAFNISSIYDPVADDIVHVGTIPIPLMSPLALRFGGESLEPEKSVSMALGAVLAQGRFSLSADLFQVDVSDRLTPSADRQLTPPQIDELVREGIVRPGGVLDRFRFFINDFSTRTRGIDLVAAYRVEGSDGSATRVASAWNWTSTSVTEYNEATLTETRIRILEEGLPNVRGNVAVSRAFPMGLRTLVRASYWGAYYDGETPYYESDPAHTIDYPGPRPLRRRRRLLADRELDPDRRGAERAQHHARGVPRRGRRAGEPLRAVHAFRFQRSVPVRQAGLPVVAPTIRVSRVVALQSDRGPPRRAPPKARHVPGSDQGSPFSTPIHTTRSTSSSSMGSSGSGGFQGWSPSSSTTSAILRVCSPGACRSGANASRSRRS